MGTGELAENMSYYTRSRQEPRARMALLKGKTQLKVLEEDYSQERLQSGRTALEGVTSFGCKWFGHVQDTVPTISQVLQGGAEIERSARK